MLWKKEPQKTTRRAVAYYRHSAQDRQENSVEIQQDQVRKFASDNGIEIIKEFADQFCSKFGVLQERGHAKWKSLSWQPGSSLPPLAAGWQYSDKVKAELANCRGAAAATPGVKPSACSPQDRVTGLCR